MNRFLNAIKPICYSLSLFLLNIVVLIVISRPSLSFEHLKCVPILDAQTLKGYQLDSCDCIFYKTDNDDLEANHICLEKKLENTASVKVEKENWMSISRATLNKKEKEIEKGKVPYSIINIERYSLGSPNDANLFANAYISRWSSSFNDGSYTGKTIGQKCWTNKDSLQRKKDIDANGYENGLYIVFIRECIVVRVNGWSLPWNKNPNPMPPSFVEDVARSIDNKLKK